MVCDRYVQFRYRRHPGSKLLTDSSKSFFFYLFILLLVVRPSLLLLVTKSHTDGVRTEDPLSPHISHTGDSDLSSTPHPDVRRTVVNSTPYHVLLLTDTQGTLSVVVKSRSMCALLGTLLKRFNWRSSEILQHPLEKCPRMLPFTKLPQNKGGSDNLKICVSRESSDGDEILRLLRYLRVTRQYFSNTVWTNFDHME